MQIDQFLYEDLIEKARQSERLRSHLNLHQSHDDPVQRLCIGLVKGTYVPPHCHTAVNKWELILTIKGCIQLFIFDENGIIVEKNRMQAGGVLSGLEMKPNTWHCLYPETEDAIIFEVKEGPYTPSQPNEFASWAPKEGTPEAISFLSWLEQAKVGERYSPI